MKKKKARWKPPKYPYKSATVKGLKRMLSRSDIARSLKEAHWFDPDPSLELALYCPPCGETALEAIRAKHPDEDVSLGGGRDRGWPPPEDTSMWCHACGDPVEVCLNKDGLEYELEYLESDNAELRTLHQYAQLLVLLESGDEWYAWKKGDPRRDRLLAACARLLELRGAA